MVISTLSKQQIVDGHKLINHLRSQYGAYVDSAFWVIPHGSHSWRLAISIQQISQDGQRFWNGNILSSFSELSNLSIDPLRISAFAPGDSRLRQLREAVDSYSPYGSEPTWGSDDPSVFGAGHIYS